MPPTLNDAVGTIVLEQCWQWCELRPQPEPLSLLNTLLQTLQRAPHLEGSIHLAVCSPQTSLLETLFFRLNQSVLVQNRKQTSFCHKRKQKPEVVLLPKGQPMTQCVWECLGDSWGSLSIMRQGLPKPCSSQVQQSAVASCSWAVT